MRFVKIKVSLLGYGPSPAKGVRKLCYPRVATYFIDISPSYL